VLVAHLAPGYFAAVLSQPTWEPGWSQRQRGLLWAAALGSTFAPDLDVVYNALFRGFFNHSTLWTHSVFLHGGIALCWLLLRATGQWPYLRTLVGIVALGGLSHLALDVVSHGTPLLYPLTMTAFGSPPDRVVQGGLWAYVTDPIFVLEPLLLALAVGHWTLKRGFQPRTRRLLLAGIASGAAAFATLFLLLTPALQSLVTTMGLV
jgi:membrane-bound metal-dependent hydrolase YbcI (DUF457 family)